MKTRTTIWIYFMVVVALTTLNAQAGEAVGVPDTVDLSHPVIPDLWLRLASPEGAVNIRYDSDTGATKTFVGEQDKKQVVYEDAEGNQYVEKEGRVYKMRYKQLFFLRKQWMKSTYPIYKSRFPAHAAAHRMAEFSLITPQMLEKGGMKRISAPGMSAVFEHSSYGIYEFDLQDRLVAMRQPPHASINFIYEPQEVVIPKEDVEVEMKLPGLFSKILGKKNKKKDKSKK